MDTHMNTQRKRLTSMAWQFVPFLVAKFLAQHAGGAILEQMTKEKQTLTQSQEMQQSLILTRILDFLSGNCSQLHSCNH